MSTTTTFNPTKDSYLYSVYPSTPYGSYATISLGELGTSGNLRNGVFEFDVSSITSVTDIVSANFTLVVLSAFGTVEKTMTVARLDQEFTETTATWSYSEGITLWTGGAGASENAVTGLPTYEITVSQYENQVVNIVELVRDAIINHNGILRLVIYMKAEGSSGNSTFGSRSNGTAAKRPTLDVVVASRFTWTGAIDDDLDDSHNWIPATVPTSDDIVLFSSGAVDVGKGTLACRRVYVGGQFRGDIGRITAIIKMDCDEMRLGSPYSDCFLLINESVGANSEVFITDTSTNMELDGEFDPTIVRTRTNISIASSDVDTIIATRRASFTLDDDVATVKLIGARATLEDGAGTLIATNGCNVALYRVDNDDTDITIHGSVVRCYSKAINAVTILKGLMKFKRNTQIDIRCEEFNIYPEGLIDTRTRAGTFGLSVGSTAQTINMFGGRLLLDPTYSVQFQPS